MRVTLEKQSDIAAEYAPGKRSQDGGDCRCAGRSFWFSIYDGGEIWAADLFGSDKARDVRSSGTSGSFPTTGLLSGAMGATTSPGCSARMA